MDNLSQKFTDIENRFEDVVQEMTEKADDMQAYQVLAKRYAELREPVEVFRKYKKVCEDLEGVESMLKEVSTDPELKEMTLAEKSELLSAKEQLEDELRYLLIPKDPNDNKNCFLEIRAGTGGDEAGIFAGDLTSMYLRYIDSKRWTKSIVDAQHSEAGGYKEIIIQVEGENAYGRLKYEAGTHRVQRVPQTEASGRVHTSAATVAVMPEVEDVELEIRTEDLRIDTYRASGAGGQHINKTDSAIRITHLPTGVVVCCQDGRSQHSNKEKAMQVLKARLVEKQRSESAATESSTRKIQVGSGDRSEKIRTYNYSQGRLTDHRINFTSYNLQSHLQGDLDEIIDALIAADRAEKLAEA